MSSQPAASRYVGRSYRRHRHLASVAADRAAAYRRNDPLRDADTDASGGGDGEARGGAVAGDPAAVASAVLERFVVAVDDALALDVSTIHPDVLADVLRQLTRDGRRLDALRTRVLAQLDRRRAYQRDGHRSAKEWAANELNEDPRATAKDVRRGRELEDLPRLADAYGRGEISGEHVDVAALALRGTPEADRDEAEADLVDAARTTDPRELGRQARRRRIEQRPKDAAADDRAAFARRGARYIERDDGGARFILDLTAGDYELHRTAAQARMTRDPQDLPDDQRRRWAQRLYDAEIDIHRRTLLGEDTPDRNGTPVTGTVIVDLETLEADPDTPSPAAHLGFAGPVTAETARRLLCNAGLHRVILDGDSEVLDVGRTRRDPTPAQVRALLAVWRGCARCGAPPAFCEAHHIRWWKRHEGPTDLDNLIPLCWSCHSAVHHAGLRIEKRPGAAVDFISASGHHLLRAPP